MREDNLEIIKLLVEYDATPTFKNIRDAINNKQFKIAKSLLSCPRIQERMLFSFLLTLFGAAAGIFGYRYLKYGNKESTGIKK